MKLFPHIKFAALGVVCASGFLPASVLIDVGQVGTLRNAEGAPVSVGRLAAIVADQGNDGLLNAGNTTFAEGNFLGDGLDDLILAVGLTADLGGGLVGYDFGGMTFSYGGGFDVGDDLYLVWVPDVDEVGATVGAGVSYGQYRTDTVDEASGANIAWVAPADGGAYSLAAFDNVNAPGAVATPEDFTASLTTTIPEPAEFAGLLGVVALGLAMWRRRGIRSFARADNASC